VHTHLTDRTQCWKFGQVYMYSC